MHGVGDHGCITCRVCTVWLLWYVVKQPELSNGEGGLVCLFWHAQEGLREAREDGSHVYDFVFSTYPRETAI